MEDHASPLLRRLIDELPQALQETHAQHGDATALVSAGHLLEVLRFARDDPEFDFEMLTDLCAVDYLPRAPRFEVVYHLYSVSKNHRLRVKVRASEDDPIESVTGLWPGANWLEREVYDQFGVNIVNHPDLRRILMPDEWQGHPQRKDYPLEGPGELLMENPQDWLRLRNIPDEAMVDGEIE